MKLLKQMIFFLWRINIKKASLNLLNRAKKIRLVIVMDVSHPTNQILIWVFCTTIIQILWVYILWIPENWSFKLQLPTTIWASYLKNLYISPIKFQLCNFFFNTNPLGNIYLPRCGLMSHLTTSPFCLNQS